MTNALHAMIERAAAIVDKPTGAIATSGGGLLLAYVAKISATMNQLLGVVAPFATLAGYLTAFLVAAWWLRKWARILLTPDRMKCSECGRSARDCDCS